MKLKMNQKDMLLAPNGKSSNLTPEQYKLVRTPEFKAWFGDWEEANILNKLKKPITVKNSHLNRNFSYEKSYVKSYDLFETQNDKNRIRLSRKGLKHICTHARPDVLFSSIDYLKQLIETAIKIEEEPNLKLDKKPNVKAYWVYLSNFIFEGDEYIYRITVQKENDGDLIIHDTNAVKKESILKTVYAKPSYRENQNALCKDRKISDITNKIIDNLTKVSKVVDSNGEPLVVYHGTNSDFTIFDSTNFNKNEKSGDYVGEGFFFTNDIEKSKKYGLNSKAFFLKSKNPIIVNEHKDFEKIRDDIFGFKQIGNVSIPYYYELRKNNPSAIRTKFTETGFDGLIDNLYNQYAVFNSENIKLADGTNTTFDTMNPDIRFEEGGNVSTALLAPNGQPSNLTPMQYKLVRSPEFKAWFGDWENDPKNASKVVDANGEPLVVYHGSDKQFTTFKNSDVGELGLGVYFSADKEVGERYKFKNSYSNTSKVYECFLNIKKPYLLSDDTDDLYSEFMEVFLEDYNLRGSVKADRIATETLLKKYDGCISQKRKMFVVYYPTQIKLADGTNTTFDMENNDIRFDKGGNIDLNAPFDVNGKTLADRVRQLVKELYPNYKWSITSGYNKLDVYLLEADFDPFTERYKAEYPTREKYYNVTDSDFGKYNRENRPNITDRAVEVFKPIREYINRFVYNSNAGDPSADYSSYNIYEYTHIGKWDKEYVQVEPKANTKKAPSTPKPSQPTPSAPTSAQTASAKPTFKPLQERILEYYLHSFYAGKVNEKFEIMELIESKGDKYRYRIRNIDTNETNTQTFSKEDLAELFKMDEYEGFLLVPNENYVEPVKPQPTPVVSAPVVNSTNVNPKAVEPTPTKSVTPSTNKFVPLQEQMVGYYLHSFYDGKVVDKFEIVELIESKGGKFKYRIRNIDTNEMNTQTFSKEDIDELFKKYVYEGFLLVAPDKIQEPTPPTPKEEIKLAVEGKFYCLNYESSFIQVTESTPTLIGYNFFDFQDYDNKTPIEETDPNFINLFIGTWNECTKPKFKLDDFVKSITSTEKLQIVEREWENNNWTYKTDNGEYIYERSLQLFTESKESIQVGNIYAGLNSAVYFQITEITPEEVKYKNYGKQNEFVSNGLMKTSDYTYKNLEQDYILLDKPKYQVDVKVNLKDGAEGVTVLNRKPEKLFSGKNSWMYLISDPNYNDWISESELEPILPKVGEAYSDGSNYNVIRKVSKEQIICNRYSMKNEIFDEEVFSGEDNVNNFTTTFDLCTIPKFIDGQEVIINETKEKATISYRTWSKDEKVWNYELNPRNLGIKSENELSSLSPTNSNAPTPQPEISIEEYFLNNFDSSTEIPKKYQITTALLMFVKNAVELKEVAQIDTEKYLTIQRLITEKLK